jgi:hypothetical protein
MKGLFARELGKLKPINDDAMEILRGVGQGEIVEVDILRPRNTKHNAYFFATMKMVWDNADHSRWESMDVLIQEAKIQTGHYDRRDIISGGETFKVITPRSMSYGAMDENEFSEFHQRVLDWIARDILPGIEESDMRREIEEMVGVRYA